MGFFNRNKDDGDTLVLDENEEFYNPRKDDKLPEPDDSVLLPVDEDEEQDEDDSPKKKERKRRAKRYGRAQEDDDEDDEEEEPEESEWGTPIKPSLSLPSRSIVESSLRKTAATRMRKVAVIVGAGLAAASVTCVGLNIYSAAQLAGEQTKGASLATAVEQLKPVADYFDGYNERRAAVSEVLTTDIMFSTVQNNLFSTADANNVTISAETIEPGEPCASFDPFAPSEGIGCVTAQLSTSGGTAALAKLSEEIATKDGISGAYLTGISSTNDESNATLNFSYDGSIMSERYKKFSGEDAASEEVTNTAPATAPEGQ